MYEASSLTDGIQGKPSINYYRLPVFISITLHFHYYYSAIGPVLSV